MNKELERIVNKIKNLSQEDLVFYKRMISFFDLLGIDEKALANLPLLLKTYPEFVERINMVISDQNLINEKLNKANGEERSVSQPFEELNKEREYLNVTGR